MRRQDGFTLIEILVVVVIIAILAAIAIPVFSAQRQKGYAAQVQSALKNASIAVESYAVSNNGDYSGLESVPDLAATLKAEGFSVPSWAVAFDVSAGTKNYCIEIRHANAASDNPWRRGTYVGDEGRPKASRPKCPAAPSL